MLTVDEQIVRESALEMIAENRQIVWQIEYINEEIEIMEEEKETKGEGQIEQNKSG